MQYSPDRFPHFMNSPDFHFARSIRHALSGAGLTLMLMFGVQNVQAQGGLPELSDTSAMVMNADQEKMFGKQVMLSVRRQSTFSEDVLLVDYFSTLTANIALHSPRAFGKTTTNVAVDPAINAFAVPGGYITINTGLIENTRNEDELASVIAHEIGHQSQRHISRSIERSKQLTIPATAALLGGILLGGQAGAAAVLGSQAVVGADSLAYSRMFEREADATGMTMLADSGYDPKAMPAFFGQLEEQSRLYGGIMPEFLSTHPVSSDRIADGMSRAASLVPASDIARPAPDRLDFAHAKTRTIALYDKRPDNVIEQFKLAAGKTENSNDERALALYGLGIAYMRQAQYQDASVAIHDALKLKPEQPLLHLALAEIQLAAQQGIEAEGLYQSLYLSDKDHPAYAYGYAKALTLNGKFSESIRLLRKNLRHHPDNLWAYDLLAEAYAGDKQTMNARFVRAQMLKKMGLYTATINLLNQTIKGKYPDQSDYLIASIKDLLAQTEQAKRQLDQFKL